MTAEQNKIIVEVTGAVARIQLNHPPLNVIDVPMIDELRDQLIALDQRPAVTTIVFSGTERVFSAGVDIPSDDAKTVEAVLTRFHAFVRTLVACRKLTIASVRRHCLGGAAELALMCDLVYAGEDAVFGFPEIKLAGFPAVAMAALSAVVGQKLAAELLLTSRTLTAKEALDIRFVNGIAEDPETLVAECMQRVAQLSPSALRTAKKAFYAWDAIHFDKGLMRADEIYREEVMRSDDAKEGIRAYLEKRRPHWTGK